MAGQWRGWVFVIMNSLNQDNHDFAALELFNAELVVCGKDGACKKSCSATSKTFISS